MHSPGTSQTGSFSQGVNRKKLLLTAHVTPIPLSLDMKPADGFAMTFVHGVGGSFSSVRRISYSSAELNPPIPLKQRRSEVSGFSDIGDIVECLPVAVDLNSGDRLQRAELLSVQLRLVKHENSPRFFRRFFVAVSGEQMAHGVEQILRATGDNDQVGINSLEMPIPVHGDDMAQRFERFR